MTNKDLKFLANYLQIKVDNDNINRLHANDIVDMCRINLVNEDNFVINRHDFANALNVFSKLISEYPQIMNRGTYLSMRIMEANDKLYEIYKANKHEEY